MASLPPPNIVVRMEDDCTTSRRVLSPSCPVKVGNTVDAYIVDAPMDALSFFRLIDGRGLVEANTSLHTPPEHLYKSLVHVPIMNYPRYVRWPADCTGLVFRF
jgi:hypothetical protein